MENWMVVSAFVAAAALTALPVADTMNTEKDTGKEDWKSQVGDEEPEKATFAGGCFWCIEAAFEDVEGVAAAVSGYAGGREETATYQQVSTGETGHREAVQVSYYPSVVSYDELLDIYWRSIDPTDPGGQFSDRGPQYTTAIYVHSEEQREKAEKSRQELNESGKFEEPVVTEIEEFTTFFPAEDRHQNYSERKTARYKLYERASGRKGFIEKFWN